VIEFELPTVQREVQRLAARESYSITGIQLLVNGLCSDCSLKDSQPAMVGIITHKSKDIS